MYNYLDITECPFHHEDCAARNAELCMALDNTDFGGRDCPFYKSKSQNSAEQKASALRLRQQNRTYLIHKYYNRCSNECQSCINRCNLDGVRFQTCCR